MIKGDGDDYDLLDKWSKGYDCQGFYSCEIGVREGGGSKLIMDNVVNNFFHVGVDPYGDRKYQHFDNDELFKWKGYEKGESPTYPDSMKDQMLKDFDDYIRRGKFHFACFTDTDFMSNKDYSRMIFSFVHFDGPHTTKAVLQEAIWFANRSAPNARFVFDDHEFYEMDIIAQALVHWKFKTREVGDHKILLEKKC